MIYKPGHLAGAPRKGKMAPRVKNAPTCYRAPRWADPEFPRKMPPGGYFSAFFVEIPAL